MDEVKLADIDAKLDKIERHALKLVDMNEEHRTELLLTRKVATSSPSTLHSLCPPSVHLNTASS